MKLELSYNNKKFYFEIKEYSDEIIGYPCVLTYDEDKNFKCTLLLIFDTKLGKWYLKNFRSAFEVGYICCYLGFKSENSFYNFLKFEIQKTNLLLR